MAFHTLESQKLKKVAIDKILGQMVENIEAKKAGKKISSAQLPKMYLRMARLLAGTEDAVFMDTIEDLVSKNASGDELKNALRGISERLIPTELKRTLSDRLHHGIPLELMDTLMKQDPEVMLDFLVAAEDDGRFFGDSRSNVDNSFQEQAHTGAKDKATAKYRNYPHELEVKGDRKFSAHPFGTNKGTDKSLDKIYGSGKEMYDAFLPAIVEAENELQYGIRADQSRRVVANKALVNQGVISPGQDFWSGNTPKAVIKEGRVVLAKPEIGLEVAAAFNPYTHQDPKDLAAAGVTQRQIADFSAEQQKKLSLIQDALENPFTKRVAGLVPLAGTTLGAGLVEQVAKDRDKEIAENPNDPTLKINKALDQISGNADRLTLAGMGMTATGPGAVVGVPMVAAGETTSLISGGLSMAIDGGRAYLKAIFNKDTPEQKLEALNNLQLNK